MLVVEDDGAIRSLIKEVLSMEGYRVEAVADGVEAVNKSLQQKPDLVLLDLNLPLLNGEPLADLIRMQHGPNVPIILITAADQPEQKAERIDANAFLSKPFVVEDLRALVEKTLQEASTALVEEAPNAKEDTQEKPKADVEDVEKVSPPTKVSRKKRKIMPRADI